jgi:hypothetical protein
MTANDLLRFDQLMTRLLAEGSAKTGIETLFTQAVILAGLQNQVWLDAIVNVPRRWDQEPCEFRQ